MKRVSITEFKNHLSHYIELCLKEDIQVTKRGAVVAVLSSPDAAYYQTLTKLCGVLKEGDTGERYNDMIGNEIMKRCGF